MLARGTPANRHRPSGLIVFVRFRSYAAAPAVVKIALKPPGTFLSMLRSSGPRQNPERSGFPSAVLGAGRAAAVRPAFVGCCATTGSVKAAAAMDSTRAIRDGDFIPSSPLPGLPERLDGVPQYDSGSCRPQPARW